MRYFIFFITFWLFLGIQTGYGAVSTLLADTQNGLILSSKNASLQQYPASLTKVMTLYLTFNALEKGLLKMDDALPISLHAARQPASKMYLKAGESIRVRDAINALIIKSANDVAVVLAEALAPSEADFAKMMTETARKLGMKNTTFRNASGLHHPNQVTTAQDMAVLTIALINHFPQYYKLFAKNEFTYHGKLYKTHNRVTQNYKGAEGLKTGYVAAVGYNIISTAKRNNQRFVTVVIGQKTSAERDKQAVQLLDKGFSMAKNQKSTLKKLQQNGKALNTHSAKTVPDLKSQMSVMSKRLAQIKKISNNIQSVQLAKAQKSGPLSERSLPAIAALDEIEQEDISQTESSALALVDNRNILNEMSPLLSDITSPKIKEPNTKMIAQKGKNTESQAGSTFKTFSAENPVLKPIASQKKIITHSENQSKTDSQVTGETVAYQAVTPEILQALEKQQANNSNIIQNTVARNVLSENQLDSLLEEKETSLLIDNKNTANQETVVAEIVQNQAIDEEKTETDKQITALNNSDLERIPEKQTTQSDEPKQDLLKDTMHMRKSSWGVQVGAFSNKAAAENQANKALKIVSGADKFVKITQTDKFYRSRIYGFKTKKSANLACRRLKTKKFNCMTLSPTLSYRN